MEGMALLPVPTGWEADWVTLELDTVDHAKSRPLPEIEHRFLERPARSIDAILTELFRFLIKDKLVLA
jgi:hypothetical protein